MLTKDDIERAINKTASIYAVRSGYVEELISVLLQSLAIDEDKAVEEMAIAHENRNREYYFSPHEGIDVFRSRPSYDERIECAKAALHASPYYKLVKMMGE